MKTARYKQVFPRAAGAVVGAALGALLPEDKDWADWAAGGLAVVGTGAVAVLPTTPANVAEGFAYGMGGPAVQRLVKRLLKEEPEAGGATATEAGAKKKPEAGGATATEAGAIDRLEALAEQLRGIMANREAGALPDGELRRNLEQIERAARPDRGMVLLAIGDDTEAGCPAGAQLLDLN